MIASSASAATGGNSGGQVRNATPKVLDGLPATTTENVGYTAVFSGIVYDANAENDLETVHMELLQGTTALFTAIDHDITDDDLAETEKGTADGTSPSYWVYNAATPKGELNFELQYTLNSAGTYVFGVSVTDEDGAASALRTWTVTIHDEISFDAVPYGTDGKQVANGDAWGAWTYTPGEDTQILGKNFVKVVNTGVDEGQTFNLDFTQEYFYPAGTARTAIADVSSEARVLIDDHLVFGYVRVPAADLADPSAIATQLATITWESAAATDGQFNGAFENTGEALFVTYKIVSPPDVLVDQDYTAELTIAPS